MNWKKVITRTLMVVLLLTIGCLSAVNGQAKRRMSKDANWVWPVDGGSIGDGFKASWAGAGRKHTGVDILKSSGAPIYAAKDGKVVYSTYHSEYGNLIVLKHKDGLYTFYAHCSKRKVKAGDNVDQGEVIGLVGSTGRSSASHVHFELRKGNMSVGYNSSSIFLLKPTDPLKRTYRKND